jgi:hypothetical protein
LAAEMERLHSLYPSEVPKESRFLLDFDIEDLAEGDVANQEHWILCAFEVGGYDGQSCQSVVDASTILQPEPFPTPR